MLRRPSSLKPAGRDTLPATLTFTINFTTARTKMSTNLQPQIDQADILITKLQQIRALWDELPSVGDLAAVTDQAQRLAGRWKARTRRSPPRMT